MSERRYTQGPWTAFNWGEKVGVTGDKNTPDIALVSGFDTKRSIEEEISNAHLIAAAPELLEAVQLMLHYSNLQFPYEDADYEKDMAFVRAAIAKAEGR